MKRNTNTRYWILESRIKNQESGILRQLLVFCVTIFSFSANAQVISLDSVLSTIDRQNPMLQEYDNKVKALNSYTEGAKSWMAPMIGVGTFMTPYPGQLIMDERDKGAVTAP